MLKLHHLILLAALPAATACSDIFGDDGPRITTAFSAQHEIPAGMFLRLDVGGRETEVFPTIDILPAFTGPRFGDVPVHAELVANGETLASVSFTQEFRRGHSHVIVGVVGRERPWQTCYSHTAVVPLPVTAPGVAPDSLFVQYITAPNDVVCVD